MNKDIRNFLIGLFSGGIVLAFLWYAWEKKDILLSLLDLSLYHIALLIFLIVITWFLNSSQGYLLIKAQKCRVGIWETFLLYTAVGLSNYIPFRPGTLLRFHYLKCIHGLRYTSSAVLMTARTVSLFLVTGVIGLSGALALAYRTGKTSYEMLLGFLFMSAAAVVIYYLPTPGQKPLDPQKNRFASFLRDFASGFGEVRKMNTLIIKLTLLLFLQSMCMILRLYVIFDALNIRVDTSIFFVLGPVSVLFTYLSITPGGIGIREGIMGYITLIANYSFSTGIFAGIVDRALLIVLYLFLGLPALMYCQVRIRKNRLSSD